MTRKLLPLFCVVAFARLAAAQSELGPEDILGHDVELTVQQAIALGLQYNLNLQIVRNDPAEARERVREAKGAYDPLLSGTFLQNHNETPITSQLQALFGVSGNRTVDNSKNYGAGLSGILPYGFSYSSGYTFQNLATNNGLIAFAPQYTATWLSSFTIPLLRDLYWDTPDYLVRRSGVEQQISDETFRSELQDGVFLVEGSYWSLAAARALEKATRQGVDTAKDLLDQTNVQYQVGTVSKVLVTQAEANLAQRESEHIVAVNNVGRAQDTLLTAILAPNIGDYSSTNVRTEDPSFVDYPVDSNEAVEKARANRPELAVAEKQVEEADITEKWAWNQKLPSLNVGASYGMNGVSGPQKTPPGPIPIGGGLFQPALSINPFAPGSFQPAADPNNAFYQNVQVPVAKEPNFGFGSSPGSAHNDFFSGDGFHSWAFTAVFSYPLGNDTADARWVQRKIELRRARTSLAHEEQDVVLSVRTAVRELQSSIDAVKAAQRARIASEETLRAEQERLRLGDSTPHNVQQFQTDFLTAQGNEINALQVYRTAITALERAQGTLLQARGISVENERERGMDRF
jgi:outer membrane protein TolC